jgi:predicted transcriptional regulator
MTLQQRTRLKGWTLNFLVKAIRMRRSEYGLSGAELSRRIGKSPSYIPKLESGDLDPSVKTFAKIVTVLDFTDTEIAWLVRSVADEDSN